MKARLRRAQLRAYAPIARSLVRFGTTSPGRRIARLVGTVDGLLHNDTDDSRVNGERWLLERIGSTSPAVIVDVGAHVGQWSLLAHAACPSATVHACEAMPASAEALRAATAGTGVVVHATALGAPGCDELRMWILDADDGRRTSATTPPEPAGRSLVVPCTTGDELLSTAGIDHVDFLKIDVEGHELPVLRGFEAALRDARIDVVQFEFTLWSAIARVWLADHYELFEPLGFRLGKLWPDHVAWSAYSPHDERFGRCNYVAARPGTAAARALGLH